MTTVYLKQGDSLDIALKKFSRLTASILQDYRKKEYYVRPGIAKKLKSLAARKRQRKADAIKSRFLKSNQNFHFSKDKSEKIYPDPKKASYNRNNNQRRDNETRSYNNDNRSYNNDRRPYNNDRRNNQNNNRNNNQDRQEVEIKPANNNGFSNAPHKKNR